MRYWKPGAHPAWPGAGLIDPSRMAIAGHSAGGAAAIAAMLADSRIRAEIDMDGSTAAPISNEGHGSLRVVVPQVPSRSCGGVTALDPRGGSKGGG
jgi:hypothetical protein